MNQSLFKQVKKLDSSNRFNKLLQETFKLMNFYAGKTSAGKLSMSHDDIVQEMMIKLHKVCKKYENLPDNELLYVAKKSIASYRTKIIRDQSTKIMSSTFLIDLDETYGEPELSYDISQLDKMVSKHSLRAFRELLSPDARKVVKLLVSPPIELKEKANIRTGCSSTAIPKKTIANYLGYKRSYVNDLVDSIQVAMKQVYPEICPS